MYKKIKDFAIDHCVYGTCAGAILVSSECDDKKINTLNYMDPGSGEYYKIKQWVDTFMRIPFNKHNILPVSNN